MFPGGSAARTTPRRGSLHSQSGDIGPRQRGHKAVVGVRCLTKGVVFGGLLRRVVQKPHDGMGLVGEVRRKEIRPQAWNRRDAAKGRSMISFETPWFNAKKKPTFSQARATSAAARSRAPAAPAKQGP